MNLNCSQTWNVSIQDESERQLENGTSPRLGNTKELNKPDKVPRDSGKRKRLISRSVREPTVGDVLIVRTNVF
ncbi:hypothetical protein [Crocosphaera sp.]|uniref:hypothetical protein n=1 Tax=Crocosphaera sp. TaxID=2729996 RepID=UPI003F267EF8|nr:hypothetical protein [Crocosphaera sp.]